MNHDISGCPNWNRVNKDSRLSFSKSHKLWYGRLRTGHLLGNCTSSKDRCLTRGLKHAPSLSCSRSRKIDSPCLVRMAGGPTYSLSCKVILYHESDHSRVNSVTGLAIIDNGSGVTLINRKVTDKSKVPKAGVSPIFLPLNTIDGPFGNPSRLEFSKHLHQPFNWP